VARDGRGRRAEDLAPAPDLHRRARAGLRPDRRALTYTVTIRVGPRITRSRHGAIAAAIDELERELTTLGPAGRRETARALAREVLPEGQVSARGELSGPNRLAPRIQAGADVRGDGSIQAYRGKVNRELIERRGGETAFDALRRVLESEG
jgi:hypothetical protein